MDADVCYQAIASRDRRFEGRFVVAVTSTRIYCRPGCPARIPRRANTRFYPSSAAAENAGFRACLRCRPDASPGTAAWLGTSATVSRALKLIFDGNAEGLAERLGLGDRHLRRLFAQQVGASPGAIVRTRRAHFAKKLLEETALPITEVALCAGYASLRRFNAAMRDTFRRAPRELRRSRAATDAAALTLKLPYKPPYDWEAILAFLAGRAIPSVETLEDGVYRRTIRVGNGAGILSVRPVPGESCLSLSIAAPLGRDLPRIVERVNRLFDLRADPLPINAKLARDPRLRARVTKRPGLRVPGAWDGFEVAVRAILGQQVSVKGARTLAGRLAARYGTPLENPQPGLTHLFPTPAALAGEDLTPIGLPGARAKAIRGLAEEAAAGRLDLDGAPSLDEALARLTALDGIGPWTAAYIAMRALNEPDALPVGDLGLRRATGCATDAELERAAERWRPFRAYATLHLWTEES